MHMIFSAEELQWINTRKYRWPIKKDCPSKIRLSIERKKKIIDDQFKRYNSNDGNLR